MDGKCCAKWASKIITLQYRYQFFKIVLPYFGHKYHILPMVLLTLPC